MIYSILRLVSDGSKQTRTQNCYAVRVHWVHFLEHHILVLLSLINFRCSLNFRKFYLQSWGFRAFQWRIPQRAESWLEWQLQKSSDIPLSDQLTFNRTVCSKESLWGCGPFQEKRDRESSNPVYYQLYNTQLHRVGGISKREFIRCSEIM